MIGALIIVLREVIEAGLIVGIVLAVTRGIPLHGRYIAGGIVAGVAGAVIVAFFAGALANALEGAGQEVFNAGVLGLAAMMLTWHNAWMARHGREMADDLKRVGREVQSGTRSLLALVVVVGVAVLREGVEVVLFLYGLLVSDGGSRLDLLVGGVAGLALGVGVSVLTFAGLVTIPLRHLFRVTGILIAFIAAGMAAQSVAFLEQADIATILSRPVWNTSKILPDSGLVGRILHTLLGYTDRPTELQLVVYLVSLAIIFALMRLLAPPAKPARPVVVG